MSKLSRRTVVGGIAAAAAAPLVYPFPTLAQGEKPIRIGLGIALSGGLAANGKAALLSLQLWADDVNARGGILGRKVEIVAYDDQTNPATVPGIYTKLLDVDKVDLIVSGYGTAMISAAMPTAMQREMVLIGQFGIGVAEEFKYDRYFHIMPTGAPSAVEFSRGFVETAMAMDPKPQTIALLGADAEYPHYALSGIKTTLKKTPLKIVYDRTYPPNTVDFVTILRSVQAANPDVIYVASYPPDSAGVIRAANEVGLKARLFGGGMVGLQFAALKTQLGPLLNGVTVFDINVPEPTFKFPGMEEFLKKYQAKAAGAGVDPLGFYLPPFSYAAGQILEAAIKGTGGLDQAKLAKYIHDNKINTVVGEVEYGDVGEWAKTRMLTIQFQNIVGNDVEQFKQPGKQVILHPAEYKSGALLSPFPPPRA